MKSLFPETNITITEIVRNISYYEHQIQMFHWQTKSYAQHEAFGNLYNKIYEFKDVAIETLMGVYNKRPNAYAPKGIIDMCPSCIISILNEFCDFLNKLRDKCEKEKCYDISSMIDDICLEVHKTKYLLTLQ